MEEKYEILWELIDDMDSLAHGLDIPMEAEFHVKQMKIMLHKKVKDFKKVYVDITWEDPWDIWGNIN